MPWLIGLALVACKSPGTIAVAFDLTALDACGASARRVVYASPATPCSACACGGCFGSESGGVLGCDDCGELEDVELALAAGHWAIVVESYGADARLVGSQCIEIEVDRDGTRSETPALPRDATRCASACALSRSE